MLFLCYLRSLSSRALRLYTMRYKWYSHQPKWNQKRPTLSQIGTEMRSGTTIRRRFCQNQTQCSCPGHMPEKGNEKGAKRGAPGISFGRHLSSFLVKKRKKTPSGNHLKIDAEKVEKMRWRSSQNGAKTGSKIMEKRLGRVAYNIVITKGKASF